MDKSYPENQLSLHPMISTVIGDGEEAHPGNLRFHQQAMKGG